MNKQKDKYQYNEAASKFHENFRQLLLTDDRLKHLRCYQEVNVQDLIPSYESKYHHFDWYIEEWDLIVELHGTQHYKVANYGNIGAADAVVNFRNIQFRDNLKATAAKAAGFTYISIPYKYSNKMTYELLISLIKEQDVL